jgi:tetratricopeptide (TPR) repeat protein
MLNIKKTLEKAHGFFTAEKYDKAIFLYAQVVSLYPTNKEYQLYCIFCDIASENSQKGQSLFDYFAVAKEEDYENAVKYTMDTINAYDGNNDKMMDILNNFSEQITQTLDAINYKDFEKLIKQRGSFKIAFEDIMFSTKVAITSKDEFFEFVNQLIDNKFEKIAYNYLDGFNEYFKYDKQIMELYNKLGKQKFEFSDK